MEIIGVHDCKVDAKGRLMLPSALKSQLDAIISEGFVLKRSIFQPCLELYPRQEWDKASISDNIDSISDLAEEVMGPMNDDE